VACFAPARGDSGMRSRAAGDLGHLQETTGGQEMPQRVCWIAVESKRFHRPRELVNIDETL
jgi:hypothetical protein